MPKGFHHLTDAKRCQISVLLHSGTTQINIAKIIGVHRSTITRELQKYGNHGDYHYEYAQQQATIKRCLASQKPKKMTPEVTKTVTHLLSEYQWSPEQISGRLGQQNTLSISHESIYQYIWKNQKQGGMLWKHLRHSGKKYNKRKGKTAGRGCIPHRVDISQRPDIVSEKTRIGDWEADTIIGAKHQGALFSCVDRVSKYTVLSLLTAKTASQVTEACVTRFRDLQIPANTSSHYDF